LKKEAISHWPLAIGNWQLAVSRKNQPQKPQTHAKLGSLGTTRCKSFGILVEAWGEGAEEIAKIAGIAKIGN
jgi:hypothetical protein